MVARDESRRRKPRSQLPLTPGEKRLIEEAAALLGLPVAQWARSILLPAARAALMGVSK